jgi:hypothetical protein
MSQPSSETFCSAVGGTVCEDCPLVFMGEAEWQARIPDDITPFMLSEAIPRVLRHLIASPDDIAAKTRTEDAGGPSVIEPGAYDWSDADTEYAFGKLRDEGLDVPPSLDLDRATRQTTLYRQMYACVGRIASANCATYYHGMDDAPQSSPLDGAATLDVAAGTLSVVARFGTDEDVDKIAARITSWAKDYMDEGDIPSRTSTENRDMLMAIAEAVDTLKENDD